MTGRPVYWTPERKEAAQAQICAALSGSDQSLQSICAAEGMPDAATVRDWRKEDAAFDAMYARAREEQADYFAAQIVEIADTEFMADRARVRIDARKWAASKMKPGTYGDKLELAGKLEVTLTDEQLNTRLAQLLGKTGTSDAS